MAVHWRPLLRSVTTALLIVAVVGPFLTFVWFTQNPAAPAVARATEWPWVGPWIGRLQERWRPSPLATPAVSDDEDGEPEVIVRYVHPPPRDYVWVADGTSVRSAPSSEAEAVSTVEGTSNLFVDERRGDWVKVRRGAVEGWVLSPTRSRPSVPPDDRPAPVVPLPGRPPDAEELRRALESFPKAPSIERFDPYLVYTDVEGDSLAAECRELVASAEERWVERYGVAVVGQAAEAILLYADRAGYEAFRDLGESPAPGTSGHASRGLVATYAGGRSPQALCRTLLHEIAHLLERRSLGPALPPWLAEGLAVDFTQHVGGGGLAATAVGAAVRTGEAPGLVELGDLGHDEFHSGPRSLHYEASALWVRYLLTDPELGDGFDRFLAYLSRGGPWAEDLAEADFPRVRATPGLVDDLLYFLGVDEKRLEAGFSVWLWALGGS